MLSAILTTLRELPGLSQAGAIALSISVGAWAHVIKRQDRLELVQRYSACQFKEYVQGRNPDACDSLVEPDVIEYLRPDAPRVAIDSLRPSLHP